MSETSDQLAVLLAHCIETRMEDFRFGHLPPNLQEISQIFHAAAWRLYDELPHDRNMLTSLDSLLLAKDAAVRARVTDPGPAGGGR